MLLYILKSIFCLLLFLGFYHLVLEKEKMHRFNRFYLLGSIVFAFIVPSFTITVVTPTEYIEPVAQDLQMMTQLATSDVVFEEEASINYMSYLFLAYFIVSGVLLLYFTKNIYRILSKTRKNEQVNYFTATVILLKEQVLPHTFLKYIFINKKEYKTDTSEQLILTHELAHVKQKHSIDVLFVELLQIVFWCVPIFKFYKKAIQLNHEFLADDAVIKSHKNISEYQHILINTSAQNNNIYLASNLNYSLTKKRLLMMTTPSSKTKILLKKLMVLPLTAGFIFAFAQRVEAQEKKNMPQIVEVNTEENGISDEEMNEYKIIFKKVKNSELVKETESIWMLNTYKRMSSKQKKTVGNLYKYIPENFFSKRKKPQVIEIKTEGNGISEKEMKEYNNLMNTAKKSRMFMSKPLKRMKELYKKMSKKQQNSVEDIYAIAPPFPPIIRNKKTPTNGQFDSWKNKDKFALWIDGKVVDNKVLNNYKNTDFSYFSGSFVYRNARSKRFPQEYQFRLYTNAAFKKMKEKEAQEKKNNINILINKKGGLLVNGKATSIKKLKEVLDNIKLDKDKAHVLINGDKKTKTGNITDIKVILRESSFYKISINNKLLPPPPPMSIVGHYKQLFKKGSKTKIYKQKDVQKMISLYKKMSKKEQQGVTDIRKVIPPPPKKLQQKTTFHKNWFITIDGQKYYYTFDKNERIARYYKNGKLVKLDIVKEYKKKHKIFEQLKNTGQHYVFKSASEKKIIEREFSDLGGMYFRMPRADKNKVPYPDHPSKPYVTLWKNGKKFYKKRNELTADDKLLIMPPPPPPNASKNELKKFKQTMDDWRKRAGLKSPPPPPQKKRQ